MCDYFWQRMENDQGDLADVVRSGGWVDAAPSTEFPVVSDWHLSSDPTVFPSLSTEDLNNNFGDPFANLCDPLLSELTGIEFFNGGGTVAGGHVKVAIENGDGGSRGDGIVSQKLVTSVEITSEEIKKPCIIPRVFQASSGANASCLSPDAIVPSAIVTGEMMKVSSGAVGCSVEDGGVQISSTRTLAIKRRKNQAKKVVCIPAPAAASDRPSGEVVPSDLWAWRKYGQKPIKGSPYPRGYYRCSSSKGCSARKQVERSRTNPNMLVITYTSEHNHPWPTQRNALAGSTRSQASKNGSSASKSPYHHHLKSPRAVKEEPKETTSSSSSAPLVKEEIADQVDNKVIPPDEDNEYDRALNHQSYKPMVPESNHPDDFFADLAELETDPMSLIFSKVLIETKREEESEDKALDIPLNMFD